jgi:hypothetical protein
MARWFLLCCVLGTFCFLSGCSRDPQVTVSGTVEIDGKPLPDGNITLVGEPGVPPVVLAVKDGKFEGRATPGKKRVEIQGLRPGKLKMADKTYEVSDNYLPARFNVHSTITAEVGADGIHPAKFEVSVK